jgi:origin recognition complex subunit 1
MLGREEERLQIYTTLRSSVKEGGLGNPIYISGLPGMGKTSTIKEIIRSLESERDNGLIPEFVWIEVNGLNMPKPELAYSIIAKALYRESEKVKHISCLHMHNECNTGCNLLVV